MAARNGYAFPTGADAAEQFDALQTVLDPLTTARLTELGIAPGARCWEAGAGGGSIARWLADRVGPAGLDVATDRDTSQLRPSGNLHVDRHDLREHSVPDGGPFDLVHARLVLLHLPQRREILHRLIAATKPGGWLLIEEFDCTVTPHVLHAPSADDAELFRRYVHTIGHAESWTGGGPGCQLHETNSIQMRPELLATGLAPDDLRRLRDLLRHPGFAAMSYQFVSTRGRKPLATEVQPGSPGAVRAGGDR